MLSTSAADTDVRLASLDGVRGWAALLILISHLTCGLLANLLPFSKEPALRFFVDGHLAVFVFFVLSGFALTTKFVQNPEAHSVMRAVVARYFRLAPPIFLTSTIAYLLVAFHLMFNLDAAAVTHSENWLGTFYRFEPSVAGLLSFSFYTVFFDYNLATSYNSNLWTMPLEFQGSMIALAIAAVSQGPLPKRFVTLLIVCAAALLLLKSPALACFVFGYLLAECYHSPLKSNRLTRIFALALLPIVVGVRTAFSYEQLNDSIYTLLAAAAVFSSVFGPAYEKMLSSKVSLFLGKISFPLYLIQIPLICSYSSFVLVRLVRFDISDHDRAAIIVVSSAGLAISVAWVLSASEKFTVRFSHRASDLIPCFAHRMWSSLSMLMGTKWRDRLKPAKRLSEVHERS